MTLMDDIGPGAESICRTLGAAAFSLLLNAPLNALCCESYFSVNWCLKTYSTILRVGSLHPSHHFQICSGLKGLIRWIVCYTTGLPKVN